jgi:PAS domain S-box-containing protein
MTMAKELRILILEDRPADAELVMRELRKAGFQFAAKPVANEADYLAQLRSAPPDLILADYSLPSYDGLSALAAAQKECPAIPFIFVSGTMGEEIAIEALQHGATDYVLKQRLSRLGPAVRRALHEVQQRRHRAQAEESLLTSERSYQEVFNAANDAIFVHDAATGAILDVNQTALDMFSYSREELLNLPGDEFRAGAASSHQEAVRRIRLAAAGNPQVFEWQSKRKNGELFWTEVALRGADIGGQARVLALVRDITQRKTAERALAESRGLLKAILDNIPDPAWLKDLEGRFLACNQPLARLFGLRVEDILGKTLFEAFPADAERLAREDKEAIAAGKPIYFERQLSNARGQNRWFETIKSPLFNERGEVTGTVGISRETTERRQTDEALRLSEDRFRSVWEHSIDGMRLIDREGRILAVNEAFCQLVKLPREKLIGKVFSAAYQGQGTNEDLEAYRRRFDTGTITPRITGRARLWNAEEVDLEVSSSFVESAREGKTLLSIFRDVTERKRAEARVAAFSRLGQQLSGVKNAREAAEIIVKVADQLLGWDACTVDLYAPERDRLVHVLNRDTVNGRREDFPAVYHDEPPSPRLRRTIAGEGQLILKDEAAGMSPEAVPFGDTARPSASLMFVPVCDGSEVIGVLSIQSYTPKAYDQQSFATLQALADHCAGALKRIRAQEALRQEQTWMLALMENLPARVYFKDAASRFLRVNRAMAKMLGLSDPAQAVGKSDADFFTVEHARQALADEQEIIRTGQPLVNIEEKATLPGSPERWVLSTKLPLRDGAGRIIGTCGISNDITERKQTEARVAALSHLGQKLSAAKTAREAGDIIVEVAQQLLGWDACTLDLYSPEKDQLYHVLMRDTINGQRVDCAPVDGIIPPPPHVRRVIETGGLLVLKDEPGMLPGTMPFGDTARPSASIMLVPVRDGSKVIGLFSIQSYTPKAYDQTGLETLQMLADHCAGALKRINAQEALTASEANYRSLVERSPDAIFLHRDGKFVYANPAALKLFGAEKPQQVLGLSIFDIVPPENHDLVDRRIRQAAGGETTPPLEQQILRLDGTPLDVESASAPFTYEGQSAVQTIMRDITERRQLEQQLRQSQKMEAIGQLAGGVAHDFNNMLAVIRGNAELLLMDAEPYTPETKECLKQVTAAAERAANLTRQLLAFSRKQVMQSRPLVLNDVIADLSKMLKRIIGEHIDLQCRYAAQLPFVQADAGMIEQVLLNLAVNARDAMPRGGHLLITTDAARFDAAYARTHPEAGAGEFVCLTVSDTGTGIAPEHLPRIFEPFFTTKEVGKGTGLGLATVYGIVKQHQGWLEVASQPGAGATFKIFLPAIPTPASAAAAAPAEAGLPGGAETILLVEDDYAVRMITRRVLESHGYKIYEATTAGEALDLWRSHAEEIALLLTDIVMPQGVTGRDLAEQLRAQRPALKVIFMSGYSADVIGKDTDFFQRTQSSFLQKPCSSRTILKTVRRCLDDKE